MATTYDAFGMWNSGIFGLLSRKPTPAVINLGSTRDRRKLENEIGPKWDRAQRYVSIRRASLTVNIYD